MLSKYFYYFFSLLVFFNNIVTKKKKMIYAKYFNYIKNIKINVSNNLQSQNYLSKYDKNNHFSLTKCNFQNWILSCVSKM